MIKRTPAEGEARLKWQEKMITAILDDSKQKYFVLGIGLATFLFGFAAGAILNIYLILTHSTIFANLRTSLDYKSSIFGDGFVLPITNMFALWFLLENNELIKKRMIKSALILGFLITLYFHISQAVTGLVNWAMPTPWHWNALGVFHAIYMFSAFSFISLFLITLGKYMKRHKRMPKEAIIVIVGGITFLVLLRLDYVTVSLASFLPKF